MRSVIFCEGKDDLWFIAYYLHKIAGWEKDENPANAWSPYTVSSSNKKHEVQYFKNGKDIVAIWAVAGKDGFEEAISTVFDKYIEGYPFVPISSLIIVRDRDNETEADVLKRLQGYIPSCKSLQNKIGTIWEKEIDGSLFSVTILPVIIPFDEEGAIETLLIKSVEETSLVGKRVVKKADAYVSSLLACSAIQEAYLNHERLVLKARFSAVIAAINPSHSTGLFQTLVMDCPWEKNAQIRKHFDVIANQITSKDREESLVSNKIIT